MSTIARCIRSVAGAWCLILLGLLAPEASGQITFFDGFEGPEFHPRWTASPRSDWTYDFEGQRLNIRGQSVPGPVGITTAIGPFGGDFSVSAIVDFGIDRQGVRALRMELGLIDAGGPLVAFVEYREAPLRAPGFFWSAPGIPGTSGFTPVPPGPSSTFRWEIRRDGDTWKVLLNQSVIGWGRGVMNPVDRAAVLSYSPQVFQPMSIDSLFVVPTPSTVVVACVGALIVRRRRHHHARLVGTSTAVRPVRQRV